MQRRTVEEELGTGVIDDGEVDYELGDLHRRNVTLPLSIYRHTSISLGEERMNATYPEPPSTSGSVVVIVCIGPWRKYGFKRAAETISKCTEMDVPLTHDNMYTEVQDNNSPRLYRNATTVSLAC
jgi:hypothetical protein